jgi:hypothetical protein
MLDHALAYAAQGWPVFSLSGYKIPFKGSHGHLDATTDSDAIRAMWAKRPRANIGFAPGQDIVIVDPDGPNAMAQLAQMAAEHGGMPLTLAARTPRGGLHLYYHAPPGVVLKCWAMPRAHKGDDGIDIKTAGGYVLLPPSVSAKGGRYEWLNSEPIAELPTWFAEWVLAQGGARRPRARETDRPAWLPVLPATRRISEAASVEELPPIEDVAAALEVIPNPDREWEDWNRIMMAAWASTAGSPEGLELAQQWGARSRKHNPDNGLNSTAGRWQHFATSPPTQIGYGTLVHEARAAQPGWMPPRMNGVPALPEALTKQRSNNPLIQLNERYSVIGDVGGKCLVLSWVPSKIDRALKVPSFQSFKSFAERYGNRYVKIADEHKPLGAHWLKWPGRESYEGIDLIPNGPKVLENGALNLWAGFAAHAAQGEWALMKRHITEVLAAGDPAAAGYIIKFAAWAVQHPGERAEVALVFRGGKGSGKGTFANALVRIFGAHGLQVFNSKHLVGAFNGHLRNCLLLFADEAFWAGDKQGESVLKGMLTERALVIEQKGVDAVLWENRLHVIMAANAEWVIPASHDERRFAMFDVSNDRVGDRAYFDSLHEELNAGGLGAMLFDLLRVNLRDWHPRHIIQSTALRHQKEMSLNPIAAWWEEFLQRGVLPAALAKDKPGQVSAAWLLESAREHASRPSDINPSALGRFLRQNSSLRLHTERGNVWKLTNLPKCRQIWEKRYGGWNWENSLEEWKTG